MSALYRFDVCVRVDGDDGFAWNYDIHLPSRKGIFHD